MEEVTEVKHVVVDGDRDSSDYVKKLKAKEIKLVLELTNSLDEVFYIARRAAIDFAIPLVTNVEQARRPAVRLAE